MKRNRRREPPVAPADGAASPPSADRGFPVWWVAIGVVGVGVTVYLALNRADGEVEPAGWPAPLPFEVSTPALDAFVGAESCGSCHESEYRVWSTSTHGRAGGTPDADLLIAAFDGEPIRFADAVVRPVSDADGRYAFEVRQDGQEPLSFSVDGVIGGGHMVGGGTQGFVSNFPDGTVRFLPFDYIRAEGVWFCNTNSRTNEGWVAIRPDMPLADCGDWPPNRVLGSEPRYANCQECHGSQIRVRFDAETSRYRTDMTSLRVNCESCHGPGRTHLERARAGNLGESADLAILTFATIDKDSSLGICFQCHALKDNVEMGYLPGASFQAHYALKLPLIGDDPFFPDGRVRTFAYQQNHVASDCYLNGSMTCVDCHDPHGQGYRDIFNQPLASRFADGQCLSCHPSKSDVAQHTFHPPASPGSRCVACHMPYLQHPELGDSLRFARSDHTIPIPRPAFDDSLGVRNACVGCHGDRPVGDLERQTQAWYGEIKPHKDIVGGLLGSGGLDRGAAAQRLLVPGSNHPLAQAAALNRFIRDHLRPNMPALEPDVEDRLRRLGRDPDIDIRAVALAALHLARGHTAEVRAFLGDELRTVGARDHDVRARWALVLGSVADGYTVAGRPTDAIVTYRKALEVQPTHSGVLLNLAIAYNDAGEFANAVRYFRRLLEGDPTHALGWVNFGLALEGLERPEEAANAYRQAVAANPVEPLAHFNLGSYHLRRNEYEQAIDAYQQAVRYDPGLGRAYYYLARAYALTNRLQPALRAARRAVELDPTNRNAPVMLEQLERAVSPGGND